MSLTSNIFPVEIPFDEFQIQRVSYSLENLESFRKNFNKDYSFFRNGDHIYISPSGSELPILGELVKININKDPQIAGSLIQHILFRAFKDKFPEIKPSFNPFTFPSVRTDHNLIHDELPERLRNIITYKKLNEIDIRRATINGKKKFMLVISSSYKWALRQNCRKLQESGFDITTLEVAILKRFESSKEVVAPLFQSIGRVKEIVSGQAIVETNKGDEMHDLTSLYLNKTYDNIKLFLEFILGGPKAESVIHNVKQREYTRNDPAVLYKEISQLASVFSKLQFKNGDGFCFTIENKGSVDFPKLDIDNPKYLFDISLSKTHTSPIKGLIEYGPYDYGKFFEISHPKVLVICHKNSAGAFTQFLGRLKDGFRESPNFTKGFIAMYRLHNITFQLVEVDDYKVTSFMHNIKRSVEKSEESFDIAIIETKEEFKKLSPDQDIYWLSKAYLLQQGITVQYIKEMNVRDPKFILDSFALQMYAKLGGTPWVLPSSPNIAREIIVGVGSTLIRNNIYAGAQQHKVVGITTFFNADGKYIFSNRSREVVYSDYFKELLDSLKGSIDIISKEQGWNDGEIVRIIFHVFKPMKDLEVEVVDKLIAQYSRFEIKFAFVSFGENHPYLLFDLNQQGVSSKYSNVIKGKFTPLRGTNLLLEPGVCLLQLKGPTDVISGRHGFTGPLVVRIHSKSTFTDSVYIVQQVFRLTNISYRAFKATQLPVSLLYATFITDQLNKLNYIVGWDPIFIRSLRNKKWFL
ncbi:Piwi domain-containing protein [Sphingobacterium faecium]|uniref:Piwi domain-containing protein n=1 Tax=Sphingobacterium faecium TaxID=34087 RepID=UPI003DA2DE80